MKNLLVFLLFLIFTAPVFATPEDILFKNDFTKILNEDFSKTYKEFKKDVDRFKHVSELKMGVLETANYNIMPFYLKNNKIIYMYAIQYKTNLHQAFYYDLNGKLRFIAFLSENYPKFPYYSYQFDAKGKFVSAIYFLSNEERILFNKHKKRLF